jgi:lipopolysaccharide export system protein LptA
MRFRAALCAFAFSGLFAAGTQAQSLKLEGTDRPIEVTADGGFELQQDNKRVIARGNAKAVQGEVTVMGDELIADYRTKDDGANEVYRVYVTGNVTMKSASETATGDTAVYDFDKGVLVLEGKDISLVNPEGSVTAHRALQYWSNERVAVAEGAAMAEDSEKRRLYADKLIAFFKEDPSAGAANAVNRGRGDISLLQGFGNVRMETAKEVVRGERGTYNVESGVATLDGGVKITQGNSQLGGGFAVVNVKGGTSRIYGSAKEAGMQSVRENGRVSALIAPSTAKQTPNTAAPAPAVLNKGQR